MIHGFSVYGTGIYTRVLCIRVCLDYQTDRCLLAGRLCTSLGSPASLDWDQHATDWT